MTDRPHDNCYWLLPGLFMAGEYPSAICAQDSADKLSAIVGCWLVRHGLTGAQALERIAAHWQLMEKRTRFPHSPQTDMQVYYIHRWAVLDSGPKHPVAIGH